MRHGAARSIAFLFLGLGLLASASENPPLELELSYPEFDQSPGRGWRKLADESKYIDAARLIDRYEIEKKGLEPWQRVNLRFHAGQLYASASKNDLALVRFRASLVAQEPLDSPIRWNSYVHATIAFLEHDRPSLLAFREEISRGPTLQGVVPNLDVVDRLIENFEKPYSEAYRRKSGG